MYAIRSYYGQLIDEFGNPTLNTQEVIDALEYHAKFIEYMPQGQSYNFV